MGDASGRLCLRGGPQVGEHKTPLQCRSEAMHGLDGGASPEARQTRVLELIRAMPTLLAAKRLTDSLVRIAAAPRECWGRLYWMDGRATRWRGSFDTRPARLSFTLARR